jgi:bacillithiol biosynthesis cysteine-adding enzyme BshC
MSVTSGAPPRSMPARPSGFTAAWLRGEADGWLPRHPTRSEDLRERAAEVRERPPAREVWERVRRDGERLGADASALQGAEALAAGRALCVTTGQQPGLFLGPLYTVYKAMTAVALAGRIAEAEGVPVVPVFWNAADDSDFGEIGTASLPGDGFRLTLHALDGADLPAGGMVGDLPTAGTERALEGIRDELAAHPGGHPILRHLDGALARAADHGELTAALLQDLFRGTGLVVVDGRWPELRRAAAPLFRRWAERRDEAADAVNAAGKALAEAGHGTPIQPASTRNGLFEIRDGRRLPLEASGAELLDRIEREPEAFSPNVTLRPLVQDTLFPNVATVAGPSEVAYHAQLAREYALLDVSLPVLFPRFEATLVPAGVRELAERRGVDVAELVRDFDAALRATADRALPDALRGALEDLERGVTDAFDRVRREAEAFDPKLAGALPDAERRARDAVDRVREKAASAARAADTRRDPAVKRYREFLRPRGVAQERVLSGLTLFLVSEAHPLDCLGEALGGHLDAVRDGQGLHWLLDLDLGDAGGAS